MWVKHHHGTTLVLVMLLKQLISWALSEIDGACVTFSIF
jgi:hypothetical protein